MTTVQDLGRPGYSHLGVSLAGAADPVSFRLANLLVGNPEGAPAIEMTLMGGRFAFDVDAVIALVGADFDCSMSMGRAVSVRAGESVEVGGCRFGARCYLAVRGGFEAKYDLGSASTHVLSGLGKVIARGDVLRISDSYCNDPSNNVVTGLVLQRPIRVTAGSGTEWFSGGALMELLSSAWRVSERSNRQGIRLEGPVLRTPEGGVMASEGVALGAIQVPPNGQPVILFVDSQTTGGYPVIANAATVDIPLVGQLRPGAAIRFEAVGFPEARRLLLEREAWIRDVV